MADHPDRDTPAALQAAPPQQPQFAVEDTPDGPRATVTVTPDAVRLLGGSDEKSFNLLMVREAMACARFPASEAEGARQLASVVAALEAFKPKDEIEGMLASQAVALHFGAMECLRRAMLPDQPFEIASKLRKDGANLARGMTDMLDALDRKRGKGPQVVRVERVVVHEGGQAIVGAIAAGVGRGEG